MLAVSLRSDEVQIDQVLVNLLKNAVDALSTNVSDDAYRRANICELPKDM